MHDEPQFDSSILPELVKNTMPFGKYKGVVLCDIPVSYLEWMQGKDAFPKGRLGMQLHTLLEIKANGLGEILVELKKNL
jgi:uncharacterized protein